VAPYLALPERDGAVRALTASVRDALEPSVLHVDEAAHVDLVRSIDALYGRGLDATRSGEARLAAAPAIASALRWFLERDPARVERVRASLARYRDALAGLDDGVLRPSAAPSRSQTALLVASLPLAAWGFIHHVVPYFIPRLFTAAFIRDPASVPGVKLMVGTISFLALYALEGAVACRWLGAGPAVALVASLPVSGVACVEVKEALGARARRRARRSARARLEPAALAELERLRADALAELDRARADYLLERGEPAADDF
jgi:hypothetical protein